MPLKQPFIPNTTNKLCKCGKEATLRHLATHPEWYDYISVHGKQPNRMKERKSWYVNPKQLGIKI